ncbi:MAG: cytochrome-c peroxidase [Chitinophagia bacterium]|nr:cytochrome-c peroxidase [Chitinophagia bacterium]
MPNLSLKYTLLTLFALALLLSAVSRQKKKESVIGGYAVPKGFPQPVYLYANNPPTEAGFKLGRKLFYDPALSSDGSTSCASCHTQWSAFTHIDHPLSHGINGLRGTRNTLSLMNLAWSSSFMWDGGVNHLEVQPLAPLTNPVEMDNTLARAVAVLDSTPGYRAKFYAAFGDSAITGQRVLKALAQFMAMLVSANAKYDQVKRHEPGIAFTPEEQQGYMLYQTHCTACHPEPLFTNYTFVNIGLPVDTFLKDKGRMKITQAATDSLKFKVPTLRNVAMTYPYMHDGRFGTLRQVLDHYTSGTVFSPTLAPQLWHRLTLSDSDKTALIAFLNTLTDPTFLNDMAFHYHVE